MLIRKPLCLAQRPMSKVFHKRQTPMAMVMNPLPGLDIGIPLNIFQNVYTQLHYGENIITGRDILLQFMIGYYVYGLDRYNDSLEYVKNPYSTTKKDLYEYIYIINPQ